MKRSASVAWNLLQLCLGVGACLCLVPPVYADDLVVDGGEVVIDSDTVIDGSVWVENGGTLTIRNARLTLHLDYDEEHHVDVSDSSRLVIENAQIDSTGGQFWFELYGDGTDSPSMEVSGNDTWLTNHSGIRPFDDTRIVVTGGDVEELQVRDRVTVQLSNAATYPVFFFDGDTTTINGLDTGENVTNTISVPGGWSMALSNAWVEGYQIDLMNGADVTLHDGDGIVLSMHTPGDLGPDLRVVEGITSADPISGSLTNLGSTFTFSSSNIALINVYVFGNDRVLLRDLHVNEVNAEQQSQLFIGQPGYTTELNCNLCQVYDHATFTVDSAVINAQDNLPSATASYHDFDEEGYGVMVFREMDLRQLDLTVREHGTMILHNCTYDDSRLEIEDTSASFGSYDLEVDFSGTPRTGPAPLAVSFSDTSELLLGGTSAAVDGWSWDFGDGDSSTQQSPTHTYDNEGTYTVSLTVDAPGGSNSKTQTDYITASGAQPATCQGEPVFIAASAHAGGAGSSVWRSDLSVFNASDSAANLGLRFLPSESNNSAAPCVTAGNLAAGASLYLEDVVLTSFAQPSAVGGIAVHSDLETPVVMSRTYNQGDEGTFGQSIPGRTASEAVPDGGEAVLVQLHENPAYRTNIGALNTSSSAAVVTIDLYAGDGGYLGRRRINLQPLDQQQINRIFTKVTSSEVTNGRADLTVSGGPVLVYASVVDEATDDPSYIEPHIEPQ